MKTVRLRDRIEFEWLGLRIWLSGRRLERAFRRQDRRIARDKALAARQRRILEKYVAAE